jgi:hypothetical protein
VPPNVSKLSGERSESAGAPCSAWRSLLGIQVHHDTPWQTLPVHAVRMPAPIAGAACGEGFRFTTGVAAARDADTQPSPGVLLGRLSPNGLKLSGARRRPDAEMSPGTGRSDTAARVRCSALFGVLFMARGAESCTPGPEHEPRYCPPRQEVDDSGENRVFKGESVAPAKKLGRRACREIQNWQSTGD